jgi:hypothetical protein
VRKWLAVLFNQSLKVPDFGPEYNDGVLNLGLIACRDVNIDSKTGRSHFWASSFGLYKIGDMTWKNSKEQ